jgi:hypothetical protein
VNKTKVIMGEYMVQIRKMSDFGSQPIIATTSGGYSESESLKHSNRPRIPYLSENENIEKKSETKQIFQVDLSCKDTKKQSMKSEDHRVSATKRSTENENKITASPTKENVKENKLQILRASTNDASSDASDDFDQHISIESNIINGESESDIDEEKSLSIHKNEPNLNIHKENDAESVVTIDMGTRLDILEGLEKRKKTELEEIAKRYMISTTYKDGSIRKQYKRDELYELIKNKLEQNATLS